jgi:transcriptional regulator GlxA family with amidase domain
MAAASGLAERTFKRRFRAVTGYTPIDYVQALRSEEAKQLLERSAAGIEAIAWAVGYEDPASLRRLFRRRTCVSPARYRRQFSAGHASG